MAYKDIASLEAMATDHKYYIFIAVDGDKWAVSLKSGGNTFKGVFIQSLHADTGNRNSYHVALVRALMKMLAYEHRNERGFNEADMVNK